MLIENTAPGMNRHSFSAELNEDLLFTKLNARIADLLKKCDKEGRPHTPKHRYVLEETAVMKVLRHHPKMDNGLRSEFANLAFPPDTGLNNEQITFLNDVLHMDVSTNTKALTKAQIESLPLKYARHVYQGYIDSRRYKPQYDEPEKFPSFRFFLAALWLDYKYGREHGRNALLRHINDRTTLLDINNLRAIKTAAGVSQVFYNDLKERRAASTERRHQRSSSQVSNIERKLDSLERWLAEQLEGDT